MKQLLGLLLIVIAIAIGYDGARQLQQYKTASVEILGVKIKADYNEDFLGTGSKDKTYVQLGMAFIVLLGGLTLASRKS
jgi:hypothetical protein